MCLDATFCRLLNLNLRNIQACINFRYVISTGGDYDSSLGQAVPGFSIFHYGLDLIAVVSTGEDVWELKVNTEIIGICDEANVICDRCEAQSPTRLGRALA